MTDLALKLQELRSLRGITRRALAAGTGLTVQALATYEKGTATPPFETTRTLAKFYNVDPKYLMGYEDSYISKETVDDYVLVSVFEKLPFGTPPKAVTAYSGVITTRKDALGKNAFAIRVNDNDLFPYLQKDDAVVVNGDISPSDGNIVLAFTDESDAKFYFFSSEGDFIKLAFPTESDKDPVVIPKSQLNKDGVCIVGVAVSMMRSFGEVF